MRTDAAEVAGRLRRIEKAERTVVLRGLYLQGERGLAAQGSHHLTQGRLENVSVSGERADETRHSTRPDGQRFQRPLTAGAALERARQVGFVVGGPRASR